MAKGENVSDASGGGLVGGGGRRLGGGGGGLYTASYLPGSQVEFVRLSSLVLVGNHHLLPLQVCKTQCISTGNSKH